MVTVVTAMKSDEVNAKNQHYSFVHPSKTQEALAATDKFQAGE